MQNDPQNYEFFVGVDIGKNESVATLIRARMVQAQYCFSMELKGLSSWLDWLSEQGVEPSKALICLEHTGVYSEHFELVSYGAGYTLWKVDSGRLASVQLGGDRTKSDSADSRKIAQFCTRFADQCVPYTPEKPLISQLKQLLQYRAQFVKMRVAALNQLHAYEQKVHPLAWILKDRKDFIEQLNQKIEQVEQHLQALLEQHPPFQRMNQILTSIPGIGPQTARKLLLVTEGFTRFTDPKKLASHAGTAPFENSSGQNAKWRKRKVSKKADQKLKVLLTTAVMSVIRKGGYFHSYFQCLMEKSPGRTSLQAINIIRNKLLKIAFTLIKKDVLFDKVLFKNNCLAWQKNLTLT